MNFYNQENSQSFEGLISLQFMISLHNILNSSPQVNFIWGQKTSSCGHLHLSRVLLFLAFLLLLVFLLLLPLLTLTIVLFVFLLSSLLSVII